MTIETLLSNLHKVKRTSNNSWMACCPSHVEKTPSLSIKDDNGKILLHCFGQQCGVDDIVAAVGMDLQDLFPPSDNYDHSQEAYEARSKTKRGLFPSSDVLSALEFESLVLVMIAKDMLDTGTVDQITKDRLWQCHLRISGALEYTRRL